MKLFSAIAAAAAALLFAMPAQAVQKDLCWDLSSGFDISFADLVQSSEGIYLARVSFIDLEETNLDGNCALGPLSKVTFDVVDTISGAPQRSITLEGRFALKDLPDVLIPDGLVAQDPDALHANPLFWELYTERSLRFSTSTPLEVGQTHLILLDHNGQVRNLTQPNGLGYQQIVSDDDPWLEAVRALAATPSLEYGRRQSLIEYLKSLDSVFLAVADSCRGALVQHTEPALGRAAAAGELRPSLLRRDAGACREDDIFLVLFYPPVAGMNGDYPPQKLAPVIDGFVDFTEFNSQIGLTGPRLIPLDRLMDQLRDQS